MQSLLLSLRFLPVQVINNVGILVFPHDQNLIDDELLFGLLLQIHLLDGHLRAGEIKENLYHHVKEPWVGWGGGKGGGEAFTQPIKPLFFVSCSPRVAFE